MRKVWLFALTVFALSLAKESFGWGSSPYSSTTVYETYTLYYSFQPNYFNPPCHRARLVFHEPQVYVLGYKYCGALIQNRLVKYTDGEIVALSAEDVVINGWHEWMTVYAPPGKRIESIEWNHKNNDPTAKIITDIRGNIPCDEATDSDGDGLSNLAEFEAGTDYFVADSDGDLLTDTLEVALGSDGMNPESGMDRILFPKTVGGGFWFNVALADDGSVQAAGFNVYGQLGDGSASVGVMTNTTPVQVAFPAGVSLVEVSARNHHALALDSNGNVWGWGSNEFGDLGIDPKGMTDPSTHTNDVPFKYDGSILSTFPGQAPAAIFTDFGPMKRIAAGSYVNLAIDVNDRVVTWGPNWHGQLGNGALGAICSVHTIPNLEVMDIAAGAHHALALSKEGRVYAWGKNIRGQLGLGSKTDAEILPTLIEVDANGAPFEGIVAIDACSEQSIALKGDGTVWAWGTNTAGVWSRPFTYVNTTRPQKVEGLPLIKAVKVANNHGMALDTEGRVWCWGVYQDGEIGDATPYYWAMPVNGTTNGPVLAALSDPIVEIGAGAIGSLSLTAPDQEGAHAVHTWGSNMRGELARGFYTHSSCTPAISDFLAP